MNPLEEVLCIKRNQLPADWVKERVVVPMSMAPFVSQCTNFSFEKRGSAEKDPGFKQIIPYIVLQTMDGKKTAIYNRQGSEARLHDLWSLGIGGHINPEDQDHGNDFQSILIAGMERELKEELSLRPLGETPMFMGLINEEITEVGQVHLGAVFMIKTNTPDAYAPGAELHAFQWEDTEKLGNRNFELWSTLALELIS